MVINANPKMSMADETFLVLKFGAVGTLFYFPHGNKLPKKKRSFVKLIPYPL
jgi:hypothetical protein